MHSMIRVHDNFLIQNVEISQNLIHSKLGLENDHWISSKKNCFMFWLVCYNITSETGTMTLTYTLAFRKCSMKTKTFEKFY